MKTKFHQRLTELQEDIKSAEFARRLGISGSTLQQYQKGSLPRIDAALSMAEAAGVSVAWLIGESEDRDYGDLYHHAVLGFAKDSTNDTQAHVSLPRYNIQASAGHGAFADSQEVADHLTVSRAWLGRYVSSAARVVIIEARGDSMEPTIRHGDLLMVEMGVERENVAAGGVFVVAVAGMIMVKRLQIMLDGDLTISSDNRAYRAETVPAAERDDKIIVHGRVFWSGGPLASR